MGEASGEGVAPWYVKVNFEPCIESIDISDLSLERERWSPAEGRLGFLRRIELPFDLVADSFVDDSASPSVVDSSEGYSSLSTLSSRFRFIFVGASTGPVLYICACKTCFAVGSTESLSRKYVQSNAKIHQCANIIKNEPRRRLAGID